jgi:hypothetical protein
MRNGWHRVVTGSALLVAALAGPSSAGADDEPAPGRYPTTVTAAGREGVYAALVRRMEAAHRKIPAFARKYGMKCSACHLSVPSLNRFGQAFKDNGYRLKNGTDDLRLKDPSYWPAFAWLWKNYEYDVQRLGGETVQRTGGFANGALVFGGLGSISDKLSFRFVPIIYEDGTTIVDHGWIRYNQAFGTDWVNIRAGSIEPDLPISLGREYNMGTSRFGLLYLYGVPGSVSRFSVQGNEPGIEIMGHDRGSLSRYTVNVFNTSGAPRAHCTFCAPGVFGRVTRRLDFANGFLRSVQLGAFGTYSTWPVGPDTSDLKGQRRFGADVEVLLGSDVLPLRVTAMAITGRDNRELVPLATRDPKYNAGLLQFEYVPALSWVFYSRLQVIRNQRQALAGVPDDFGDQDFQLLGLHYKPDLTTRFAWWLELSYWRQHIKRVTPAGQGLTLQSLWLGTHVAF